MKKLKVVHTRKNIARENRTSMGSLLSFRKEKTICFEKNVGTSSTPKLHKKKTKPSPPLITLRMSWKPNLPIRITPAHRNIPLL